MTAETVIRILSNAVWDVPTLIFFLAVAFYLSVRTGFIQVRRFSAGWRAAFTAEAGQQDQGGEISPFKSFMTMLAGAIGSGNIAGVATAIATGGPGAIFWMWIAGFLSMALKFTEAFLGFHYRIREPDGRYSAGPMYYLRDGLNWKMLAAVFAFVAGVAAVSTGPMVQSNTITTVLESEFGVNRYYAGALLTFAVWIVVIGGLHKIAVWAERLVPLKLVLYIGGSLIVCCVFFREIPATLALILQQAFTPTAAIGGFIGSTVQQAARYGLARGMYANEAGMGTAAYMYGVSKSRDPIRQGMIAMVDCFVITFITCTATALVVVVSGAWSSGLKGAPLVAAGFNAAMPRVGGWVVAISATLFAYTNLIGWSYYGEKSFEFILGKRVTVIYRWVYCLIIPIGSLSAIELVWNYGDILNGLQAIFNLVAVVLLAGAAVRVLRRPS
jgi:alanine or glycine:cation symporter, AGCS family